MFAQDLASRRQRGTDTTRSRGTTSSPQSTGSVERRNRRYRRASCGSDRRGIPLRVGRPPLWQDGTTYGREPCPSRREHPATPPESGSSMVLPLQSVLRVSRILHLFNRISLAGSGWTVDMSCFVELSPEPSPGAYRKALFECRADATPADRLLQSTLDLRERDLRITWRSIRTQGRRTSRARVVLVLGAAHVPRSGRHCIGRFLGAPRAYRSSLRSPVSHRPIPGTSPASLTIARKRCGNPKSTVSLPELRRDTVSDAGGRAPRIRAKRPRRSPGETRSTARTGPAPAPAPGRS